jgi:mRNA (guanine-N7-)-methyltransferase
MLNFHNQGIKRELYSKHSSKGSLLELACGEGGDMNRWIDSNYKFVLGVDLVKSNICNPRSGAYSRMIKRRGQYIRKQEEADKLFFTDMVFVVGDCGANIKDGTASLNVGDEESAKILKIVMNNQKNVPNYYRYISGKGIKGFDAVSCMFAIHYFFESENKLDGFLNNVSSNLKKGGSFFCTFMDGKTVIDSINKNDGKMIEGRKTFEENSIPVWAIIKQFSDSDLSFYNKKIDVYIENTQKLISEYVVNYELLLTKAKLFNLEISESEMFGETFNKLKANISSDESKKTHLDNDLKELDKDNIQKQFSFLNRWCVFKKI